VKIADGASIGAKAVCIAPISIGEWAFVAAGAIVSSDVPAFALVAGIPATRQGWVGRAGLRLIQDILDPKVWRCTATGDVYHEREEILRLIQTDDVDPNC